MCRSGNGCGVFRRTKNHVGYPAGKYMPPAIQISEWRRNRFDLVRTNSNRAHWRQQRMGGSSEAVNAVAVGGRQEVASKIRRRRLRRGLQWLLDPDDHR